MFLVLKEAGLPDGVFNVVQGLGETGSALTSHKGCDKLSFTGYFFLIEKVRFRKLFIDTSGYYRLLVEKGTQTQFISLYFLQNPYIFFLMLLSSPLMPFSKKRFLWLHGLHQSFPYLKKIENSIWLGIVWTIFS